MERKILFPQIDGIMHGADYNPEQWLDREDILEEDIRMMKKANITEATLGVFSWTTYEPREGDFHFEWLKKVMDTLYENGIYTVLATPSGARPAWLDEKYPDAMRVDSYGRRAHHGVRHNHCMSSPSYRNKVSIIINRLIDELGEHPGLLMWHVSNEFGGECFCPSCVRRFQNYLAEKYDHDIEKLNKAWWNTFWSHNYNDFSQIEPPYANGEYSSMGLNLEWKRFTTWNMTDYMKSEIGILRERTPKIPVTTNFMSLYPGLDYRIMAKELDVVSWDSYPQYHNDREKFSDTMAETAFNHALMRSMKKDRPFMQMESAPGLVNWHGCNKMQRPGVLKLASMQAVALGSDTVQYFQWRKGRGSYEQYHGAVVDHLGTDDTRIFKETASLGEELKKFSEIRGTLVKAKVAMIFDWDNMWAVDIMRGLSQESKKYPETCVDTYKNLMHFGIDVDVIASEDSFEEYQVIVAPMLYMLKSGVAGRLSSFVENGGHLFATYLTGYVDENQLNFLGGFPGDGLKDVFGLVSEEIDSLYPKDTNFVEFDADILGHVRDYAEVLRLSGAESCGSYTSDYYGGSPAVTENKYGKGKAYYVAARLNDAAMQYLFAGVFKDAGIQTYRMPEGVERHTRTADGREFVFYLNCTQETQRIENVYGKDILTGEETDGTLELGKYQTAVFMTEEE